MNTPTMEVPVPTLQDAGLEEIDQYIARRQELKAAIADSESLIADLDSKISDALKARSVEKVIWGDYLVVLRKGSAPRAYLDRRILVDLGVDFDILNAATQFGKAGKPGITVRHFSKATASEFDYGSGE